jgi:site-specific DNA-methyltransferase (adenine-specific)
MQLPPDSPPPHDSPDDAEPEPKAGDDALRQELYLGDNLELLPSLPEAFARLIYIDPPFHTGKRQALTPVRALRDEASGRAGFSGHGYRLDEQGPKRTYRDTFSDYLGFLMPRIEAALPALTEDGSLFVHVDYRESHYVKVALDQLLGRASFMNEIIWAYDYGGRSKRKWSAKHDTLLWYALNPKRYVFDFEAMDRIPYMAPGLVGPEKAKRGKTPTDVWWHTIVPPGGRERTGYPTQKPLGIVERVLKVHTERGDTVLDFFAGSGTTGAAAQRLGRGFCLIDENPEAVEVMEERLGVARQR